MVPPYSLAASNVLWERKDSDHDAVAATEKLWRHNQELNSSTGENLVLEPLGSVLNLVCFGNQIEVAFRTAGPQRLQARWGSQLANCVY